MFGGADEIVVVETPMVMMVAVVEAIMDVAIPKADLAQNVEEALIYLV